MSKDSIQRSSKPNEAEVSIAKGELKKPSLDALEFAARIMANRVKRETT